MNQTLHNGHRPFQCTHCEQPLNVRSDGTVVAWRASTGRYFCTEFCAEDDEEAAFQARRRAS